MNRWLLDTGIVTVNTHVSGNHFTGRSSAYEQKESGRVITSIKLDKVDTKNAWHVSYAFSCPKIVDKLFNFIPGLNVICGYNGCGKSTLLNVIRKMTFCDKAIFSHVVLATYTPMRILQMVDEGYFDRVNMINDWKRSIFSLRPSSEIDACNQDDSIGNLLQAIDSHKHSSGMDTTYSLMELLDVKKSGKYHNLDGICDFEKMVLDAPLYSGYGGTPPTIRTSSTACYKKIRDYFATHHADSNMDTIILDEPDRSIDVCMLDALYKLLCPSDEHALRNQYIAVFHNPALLYRLHKAKLKGKHINFIELTDGYLDNIDRFIEGQPVIRPTAMDWLCERKER